MKRFKLLKFLKMMLLLPIFPMLSIQDGDEEEEVIEEVADEEETIDEEVIEDEVEDDLEEEPIDKKTHAIIKAKQKAKAAADENKALKAELETYRLEEQKKKDNERLDEITQKYLEDNWNEDIAKKMAAQDFEIEQLKRFTSRSTYERQAEKLEAEYPNIFDKLDSLIDLCKKTGWSLAKVAQVELDKSTEYDRKVRNDQAEVAKSKATVSNKPTGNVQKLATIKLSSEDEAAYKFYEQHNKGVTRKQYKERVLDPRQKRE